MLAYVTGSSGFVGSWLSEHLAASGDEVVAAAPELDVTDAEATRASLTASAPDVVYHLAGLAHVGRSWDEPARTLLVNGLGTLNVLEAAAACPSPPRVIVVSSAEVYGATAGGAPVGEEAPVRPVSPYAASKAAGEVLALQAFLGRSLPVVVVRPFNHVGPRQAPHFVVSALARRVVEAERSGGGEVPVGNLEPRRDFTDVRDVVRAYRLLAEQGEGGQTYNVASGVSHSVGEVADLLASLASADVTFVRDPELVRPVDVPVLVGDATRLRSATGWAPEIPLKRTLGEVLSYWRSQAARPE